MSTAPSILHRGLCETPVWDDPAARAAPEFLTEETGPGRRYQGRLFWLTPFRGEALVRFLDLNSSRATEERRQALAPVPTPTGTGEETEGA